MSFIYPRVISITRPPVLSGIGAQPYQGLETGTETTVATGISASIQQCKESKQPAANLPGDVTRGTLWYIFFRRELGLVRDRDIITDDLGIRYQITAAYWKSLGYKCLCERLQT
jgi:hypothetical protein